MFRTKTAKRIFLFMLVGLTCALLSTTTLAEDNASMSNTNTVAVSSNDQNEVLSANITQNNSPTPASIETATDTPTETPVVTPVVTPVETPVVTPVVTPVATPVTEAPTVVTEQVPVTQEKVVNIPDTKTENFKTEVLRLVNIEREKVGISPLKSMDVLDDLADIRAEESASSFSHTRPDGRRCFTVFSDASLKYKAIGENLAYGFSTPAKTVSALMNSPTHKANILDESFEYIGIGYFVKSSGKIYCSQLFYTK